MARQQANTGQTPIWNFEKAGDKHEGIYAGTQVLDPQYKPLYVVGDKLVKAVSQVEKAFRNIPVGSMVWLEFQGKVGIKGGKTVNTFVIEFDADGAGKSKDDEEPF